LASRGWTRVLAVGSAIASVLVVVLALQVRDLTDEVRRLRFERNLPRVGDMVPGTRLGLLGPDSVELGSVGAARRHVWFVFNTTCPICAASIHDWNAAAARLREDSTVLVLGVSLDVADLTERYAREHQVIFPVALLDGARAAALYRIRGVPVTMVVDQAARIRLVRPGRFTPAAADSLVRFLAADPAASGVVAGQ
jgi:peroxiredoxin